MWVLIPKPLQGHMLEELHQDHPGVARMMTLARSHVWWPGLGRDLESLAKSCIACQSVKQAPSVAPLRPWVWPTKPWERIHIYFAGPFQGKMYLIAVDAHSKWPKVYEMAQTTATKTITVLCHLFSMYGLPEQVHGVRQWATIYVRGVCNIYEGQWNQACQGGTLPSCLKWPG